MTELLKINATKGEGGGDTRTVGNLDLVLTECDKAAEVVNRISQFYRPADEDQPFVSVPVNSVVEDVVALTEPHWKTLGESRGVRVDAQADLTDVPAVAGDQHELEQALANLVLNAVEAIEVDGTITIRTRAVGSLAQIEVADTGPGMTEEVRARCFEPFFTTKEDAGGGLGLSSVHGIIERHGGTIGIESRLNEGTTFRISLPVGRGEEAEDGREGLDRFRSGAFDVVITDLSMPNLNGSELALAIKQESPGTPVILMTGFGEEAMALGSSAADTVLRKPVSEQQFLAALEAVCGS